MKKLNFGIIGTGFIAGKGISALHETARAEVLAVASRTSEKAQRYACEWNIPRSYGCYEDLMKDKDIDVVYIATPHNLHYENMLQALNSGKHVLCEKPLTLNTEQAKECIELAARNKLFLMEGMWTRFFPAIQKVNEWLSAKVIGAVSFLNADFFLNIKIDHMHRLYNPNLGGGALLDLGVYPISLATMIWGKPLEVTGVAQIAETGVDQTDSIAIRYEGGGVASLG